MTIKKHKDNNFYYNVGEGGNHLGGAWMIMQYKNMELSKWEKPNRKLMKNNITFEPRVERPPSMVISITSNM
jgi:hypothetical protein